MNYFLFLCFKCHFFLYFIVFKYAVDSRYIGFGCLEQPLISKRKSGPCLTSGKKILWIRGEIAPQEQFLPIPHTIFNIYF